MVAARPDSPQAARSITASGATGGSVKALYGDQVADLGGRPAVVSGTVSLTAGQVLYVVVGQTSPQGFYGQFGQFGGGGGGSFVFLGDLSTPLIVAGAPARGTCMHIVQLALAPSCSMPGLARLRTPLQYL